MNPHIVAVLEGIGMAFAAGAWTAVQPLFTTGKLPDQTQWGTIVSAAIVGGLAGVYLRYKPSPAQVKACEVKP